MTHRRFAVLARAGAVAATVCCLAGAVGAQSTFGLEAEKGLHGSFSTYMDWRRGANSPSTRQDVDIVSDLDVTYRPDDNWNFSLALRGVGDADGRRPSFEPGIYNGIQETYKDDFRPQLYRLYGTRRLDRSIGNSGGKLSAITLGRFYTSGEELVWLDGAELTGELPMGSANATFAVYGGVPARLWESEGGDWLAGGRLSVLLNRVRVALEAYHVEDDARFGWTRRSNVGRLSLASPLGEQANLYASVRAIDDEGVDGQVRVTANMPHDIQLRGNARFQSQARGPHANEVDPYDIIMRRASGVMRSAYGEYGGDALIPVNDRIALDLGASSRTFDDPQNLNNINFDRYFASVLGEGFSLGTMKLGAVVTFEAYNSAADWTRAVSGEATLDVNRKVKLSAGSSYALYSYDYMLNEVSNDVRTLTAKIQFRPSDRLRLEARYDAEDDDYRLHHYVHAGFRYDF